METTTLVAATPCEEFSGLFIGIAQNCVNYVSNSYITPGNGAVRGARLNIGKEFMFTVEVSLNS